MAKQKYPAYSVLMTVYYKEKAEFLREAIDSMLNQTVKPAEFVLVEDGPLTDELYATIAEYKKNPIFKIIILEKNQGLGLALKRGINECSNELIARMDSDDYSRSDRIEKQLQILEKDPTLDIIGSNVDEFTGNYTNVKCRVILPETNDEIIGFSKKRCPFRHPSLLYKKQAVLNAGNYRHYYLFEDYDIYIRMIRSGAKSYNIQEPLTCMRISDDFFKRRGGFKYAKSIIKFKTEQLTTGYFSLLDYLISMPAHVAVCLMPNFARDLVYKKLLRK